MDAFEKPNVVDMWYMENTWLSFLDYAWRVEGKNNHKT